MTDEEMAIYMRSPDTFFGVVKPVGRNHTDPLTFFESLHETYINTPRARLLEFMKDWSANPDFSAMPDIEISEYYCARIAESVARQAALKKSPTANTNSAD